MQKPNTRNCDYCGEEYTRRPSVLGKYCSKSCMGKDNARTGSRANLTYKIPKGSVPWNKNKGRADLECPNCHEVNNVLLSQSKGFCNKKCRDEFQCNPEASYGAKHRWVKRHFGTPSLCEHCGTTDSKKFEWANISQQYKLVRSDWARLCCQCHRRYDLGNKNKIEKLDV